MSDATFPEDPVVGPVLAAIAHESRRALLAALAASPGMTRGALCALLPVGRQAASHHLGILEEAGLVTVYTVGRTRLHYPNPIPLEIMYRSWIEPLVTPAARATLSLKTSVERRDSGEAESSSTLREQSPEQAG